MNINDWKTVADTVQAICASGALFVAGWWAYRKLRIEGQHEQSLQVAISVKVLKSNTPALRILEVRCDLKNVGKVPCPVDLPRSTITISHVTVTSQAPGVVWQATPYFSGVVEGDGALMNVPVGASMARVSFAGVPHPGVYGVRALFALTEAGTRQYYKRMGLPFPTDWQTPEHAVTWDDSIIVSTETEQDIQHGAPNTPLQPSSGAGG